MDLTDSFTWEDLPNRDADTGRLTASGWIPLISKYAGRTAFSALSLHFCQSTVRIVTNHETLLPAWYPFDWTISPFYELVNISQVTIYKIESALSLLLIFLILRTDLHDLLPFPFFLSFFFFLCFFRSVLFPSLIFQEAVGLQSVGRSANEDRMENIFS